VTHKLIDIDLIRPSAFQSASEADKPSAEDVHFAEETGILTPVLVRQMGNKAFPEYELLGEEKSWFIAQQLMQPKVPAVVMNYISDRDAKMLVSLRRRAKTEDPIRWAKVAESFLNTKRLYQPHYSITDAAKELGVERTRLSHALRLINRLHPNVQAAVSEGKIKVGHARRLASLPLSDQLHLTKKILLQHLSVRAVEAAVKQKLEKGKAKLIDDPIQKPVYLTQLEANITDTMSVKAQIDYEESSRSGELRLTFHDLEELQGILERLGVILDT
jgi:ParB family chromosome partitioning protein